MDRKIGLIGRHGSHGKPVFYKMVTEMTDAQCDQDHVNMIIYSDPSMPDRTSAIQSGEYKAVHDKMLSDAKAFRGLRMSGYWYYVQHGPLLWRHDCRGNSRTSHTHDQRNS